MASSSVIVGSKECHSTFFVMHKTVVVLRSDKYAVETKCGCRGSVVGLPAAPLELCCHAQATNILAV